MTPKPSKVVFKSFKHYAEVDTKTRVISLDKRKFKGMEGFDSILHERNHLAYPKMSERDIINKTAEHIRSYQAII
jgi:hypothetical protein